MGTTANTGQSTWEQIHGGVRETERLIGQKNYNLAMVKARQTLEEHTEKPLPLGAEGCCTVWRTACIFTCGSGRIEAFSTWPSGN